MEAVATEPGAIVEGDVGPMVTTAPPPRRRLLPIFGAAAAGVAGILIVMVVTGLAGTLIAMVLTSRETTPEEIESVPMGPARLATSPCSRCADHLAQAAQTAQRNLRARRP